MKNKSKLLAATILAIPAAIIVNDVHASASQMSKEETVVVLGIYPEIQQPTKKAILSKPTVIKVKGFSELEATLEEHMRAYNTEISLNYIGDTSTLKADIQKAVQNILAKDDYIEGTYNGYSFKYSYTATEATITMTLKYLTTAEQEKFVDQKIKEIASAIRSNVSTGDTAQLEMVKAVNDYIVFNTTYSFSSNTSPHAVYSILNEQKGVCQAYALLAYRLFKELGLDAHFVTGNAGGPHAWNLVKVDGNWYHLDTTWNDPTGTGRNDFIQYKYFLLSDAQITKDHTMDSNKGYPKATMERYNAFHTVVAPLEIDSVFYYPNTSNNIKLTKLAWKNNAPSIEQLDDVRVQYLAHYDGWLYFSNYSRNGYLYKVRLDGTQLTEIDRTVVTNLKVQGNKLIYQTTSGELTLNLVEEDATVNNFRELLKELDTTNVLAVIKTRLAYNSLTKTQQKEVGDISKLTDAEITLGLSGDAISPTNNVIKLIAALDENKLKFVEEVIKARAAYIALSDKSGVSNLEDLTAAENLVSANKEKAKNWEASVATLSTDDTTTVNYYEKVEELRGEYNKLTFAQQISVSKESYKKLVDAEETVAEEKEIARIVAYQISVLNNNSPYYFDDIKNARRIFNELTVNQKKLLDESKLIESESIAQQYQKDAAAFILEIQSWSNKVHVNQILEARDRYQKFSPAIQYLIQSNADVMNKLEGKIDDIASLEKEVVEVIQLLENLKSPVVTEEDAKAVEYAKSAYAKLGSSSKIPTDLVAKLESLVQQIDSDKNSATSIDLAIIEVEKNPTKEKVIQIRENYKKLSDYAKSKVTKFDALVRLEEFIDAMAFDEKIVALNNNSSLETVKKVRAEYNLLLENIKAKVRKINLLEQLEAELVDTIIEKLSKTSTAQEISVARTEYEVLVATAKKLVKTENVKKLVELEKAIEDQQQTTENIKKAVEQVISQIEKLNNNSKVEEIEAARKAYDALVAEAKPLVTNYPTLVAIEEKFKNDLEEKTAKEQAEAVQALIDKLTIQSSKEEILAARAAYNALSSKALAYIKSITKLLEAEEQLNVVEEVEEKKAKEQAQVVNGMISKLTRSSTKEEVLAVQAAYTALSARAKKYVINYSFVQTLLAEYAKQEAAIAAAKASAAAFDKFMASVSRQSSNSTIAYARTYYNSLSYEAKQYVTTLSKLQKLEEQVWKNPSGPPKQPTHENTKKEDLTGIIWPTKETNSAPLEYIPDNEYVAFVQDGTDLQFTSYEGELFAYIPRDIILHQQESLIITATSGVQVKLPIKDLQKTYGTVSVSLTIEEGEFDFIVSVNGQSIDFAEQVEIKIPTTEIKASSNATVYMLGSKNSLVQVPFTVNDGVFTIKVKSGGYYEVSNTLRTFVDATNDPNRKYIEELSKRGLLAGSIGNNYFPKEAITRADFAVMLAKAANLKSTSRVQFNDVRGKAYGGEIQALYEAGIMKGTGTTFFNANGQLTRQQAAIIIHHYLEHLKVDVYELAKPTNLTYTDADQFSEEGKASVVIMDMLGIFSSNDKGQFEPNRKLTRSEMAEVLYLTMDIAGLLK